MSLCLNLLRLKRCQMISFSFSDNFSLGATLFRWSESYKDPYDAFEYKSEYRKKLCIVSNNIVIRILDTKLISVKWAVACAKHVLHIFEEKYPYDKRPRKAIEAASNWIKDPSEKNRIRCKDAANDISAVSYAVSYTVSNAAYFVAGAASYNSPDYAFKAVFNAEHAALNKSSEIKWQRNKLNQIVYEDILILLVRSQYQRIDNKLVRKIPKELLEYIGSFIA